jgi:NAD(P)-dependent dehydrogenase (short-subunit alcohol dehydrogenase family)
MGFEGRAGVIVGATGGIGAATARWLAARGARLALVARREEPLAALAAELGAHALPGDAQEAATAQRAVEAVLAAHGRIDFVVHAVGSIVLKPLARLTEDDMLNAFRLNTVSAFHTMKAAVGPMSQAKAGAVVVCSSVAASTGLPNHEAIAAAKAALEGLIRAAAMTYAGSGVRFNAIAPGLTRTPLAAGITGNARALEASLGVHPLGRLCEPEEAAEAIGYLLGAPNVTGSVLPLDGGMAAGRLLR